MGKNLPAPGLSHFLRGIAPLLGPAAPWFFVSVLCALAAGVCNILQTVLFKELIDWATAGGGGGLLPLILRAIVITVVWIGLKYLWSFSGGSFRSRAVRDLNAALAGKTERVRVDVLEERHSGETLSRFANDVKTLEGFLGGGLTLLAYFGFLFFASIVYMLVFHWKLAIACQLLTPLSFYLNRRLGSPLTEMGSAYGRALACANTVAQDTLGGVATVKSFTLERTMGARFSEAVRGITENGCALDRRNSQMIPLFAMARSLPVIVCALLGCYLAIRGELSVGSLATFSMLMGYVVGPAMDLPRTVSEIRTAAGAGLRVLDFLDLPEERKGGGDFPVEDHVAFAFQNVSFSYVDGVPVLAGLSFEAARGRTLALVGRSGSGKSTAMGLMCGYRSPSGGRILFFGRGMDDWSLPALRSKLSIVSQDPFLVPDTIAANIRCGRPGASDAEVERAARTANAHEFIMASKNGYESLVGERGLSLSGGERQRIALARAIIKDAEVLLLDEPTSALDYRSEALVQEALERIRENRTVVVIAHRLSTVQNADLLVVLEGGRAAESGTHGDLLAADGLYARLYREKLFLPGDGEAPS